LRRYPPSRENALALRDIPPFESALLVVAHPDDEILWFSSVIDRMQTLVFCFEDCDDLPKLGRARRGAAVAYPMSNVTWLRLPEPCSVHAADWKNPIPTPYGMALNKDPSDTAREARYQASFAALQARLRETLRGARNVYTHNPWGEYGHPDHVQVSLAVRGLQPELGFRLWYSCYVSPLSMTFAQRFLPRLFNHQRLATNQRVEYRLRAVYDASGAWTWHPSYERFEKEAMLEETDAPPREGASVPLNYILP
jgi:LmbE family N-acetylglucosaminyl deacetylase